MPTPYRDRLARAERAMAAARIDALLVGAGADLRYLTGYVAPPLERLTLLVARADGAHTLIVPRLERAAAEAHADGVALASFGETDSPYALASQVLGGLEGGSFGVGDQLWSMFLLGLQDALPKAAWRRATPVLRELRMRKDAAELDALRRAAQAIDRVHRRVPALLAPGRTETEVARDIAAAMVEEGHERADFTIVGSGPNGASPHHEAGERRLEAGDAVVVDIGGPMPDGYFSDCTRNYVVGQAPDGYREAHAALEAAQRAACEAVRPGASAASVDAAAREVLREAGYAEWFIHRTGHGIGLDVHEEPYIVEGNDLVLEAGMTFSVEPGIYLPDRFGLRIEDIVAVTGDGVERLNTLEREAVVA
ncbi:MAG TPA: Xaa-Pro peptidase family protein [Egibacteraceae bacterium]|nr:Xaa-Pro peptidase family protein [Egibacteraceae bacterium]